MYTKEHIFINYNNNIICNQYGNHLNKPKKILDFYYPELNIRICDPPRTYGSCKNKLYILNTLWFSTLKESNDMTFIENGP